MFQISAQIVTVFAGITQPELFDGFLTELPSPQVLQPLGPFLFPQQIVEIFRRLFIDRQKLCPAALLLFHFFRICNLRQIHPCPFSQRLHSFLKCGILILHQERKHIASRPTSETVIHLFALGNGKRG